MGEKLNETGESSGKSAETGLCNLTKRSKRHVCRTPKEGPGRKPNQKSRKVERRKIKNPPRGGDLLEHPKERSQDKTEKIR